MTYRDWMKEHHPENVDEDWNGGVMGCPYEYQLEPRSERPCVYGYERNTCEACWDREMPEKATKTAAEAPKDDPVNHPSHYTSGGVECIDAIRAACEGRDAYEGYLTGQVIKYIWRYPFKNGLEDLRKAEFYLKRLIEKREEKLHESQSDVE